MANDGELAYEKTAEYENVAYLTFLKRGYQDLLTIQYVDAQGEEHCPTFMLDFDRNELIGKGVHLTDLFENFRRQVDSALGRSDPEWKDLLHECARAGRDAFDTCFVQNNRNATDLTKLLRTLLSSTERGIVEVITRSPEDAVDLQSLTVPWELFHFPFPDEAPPEDFSGFLGANSVIVRAYDPTHASGQIALGSGDSIGLIVNDVLGREVLPESKALSEFAQAFTCEIDRYKPSTHQLRPTQKLQAAIGFLRKKHRVKHFACHAEHHDADQGGCLFHISAEEPIRLRDVNSDVNFETAFVFFNACSGARVSAKSAVSFASSFLSRNNARTILTSECKVGNQAAALFSQQLYGGLVSGDQCWKVLLGERKKLFEVGSPTGLIYSLHGDPSINFGSRPN
jgi:hypothetical protein